MLYIIYIFKIRNFGLKLKSFRNHGVILGIYFYLQNNNNKILGITRHCINVNNSLENLNT